MHGGHMMSWMDGPRGGEIGIRRVPVIHESGRRNRGRAASGGGRGGPRHGSPRAGRVPSVAGVAFLAEEPTPAGGVRVRYRRRPGVEGATRRLAELEADCCGSLTWKVVITPDEVHLLVDGADAHTLRPVLI